MVLLVGHHGAIDREVWNIAKKENKNTYNRQQFGKQTAFWRSFFVKNGILDLLGRLHRLNFRKLRPPARFLSRLLPEGQRVSIFQPKNHVF